MLLAQAVDGAKQKRAFCFSLEHLCLQSPPEEPVENGCVRRPQAHPCSVILSLLVGLSHTHGCRGSSRRQIKSSLGKVMGAESGESGIRGELLRPSPIRDTAYFRSSEHDRQWEVQSSSWEVMGLSVQFTGGWSWGTMPGEDHCRLPEGRQGKQGPR